MKRDRWLDAALTAALLVVSLSTFARLRPERGGAAALLFALLLVHTVPTAVRRSYPLTVHALSAGSAFAVVVLGFPQVTLGVTLLVAVYSSATYRDRRTSALALAATVAAMAGLAVGRGDADAGTVVGNALALGAAWLLGDSTRQRAATALRARDEAARRAVADERMRIARELHDVVAHALSVVAVQSGSARLVAARQPERAAEALATIEDTTRAALAEMRQLLGVLRAEDDGSGLAPQPGLAGLDALVAQVSDAGVPVRLVVTGEPRPLPQGLEVSAYRIVQEALTNVLRHAGRAAARVLVRYEPDRLDVEVVDDGDAAPTSVPGPGHGLVGMRERVALYGGTFSAGPRPGGGFRVAASLPVERP